jgi:hypothetical protein
MGPLILVGVMMGMLIPVVVSAALADLTMRKVLVIIAVLLLTTSGLTIYNTTVFQELYWSWGLPPVPVDEAAFVTMADQLHAARIAPAGDQAAGGALQQVAARLCAAPNQVTGWVGRVEHMYPSANGDHASLAIRIAIHVVVRTALFPDTTDTVVRSGTPLFATVSELREGEVVRFAGDLVGHTGACPGDPPTDPNEALRDPEFLFRFASVTPVAG